MGNRGRVSSAELSVVAPIDRVPRQKAPHDLNDEEVEVWAAVVNAEPADWFSPSNVPLVAQYCRHVVQARRIAELIEKATSDPELTVKDYDRLLAMQDRESRAIATLAQKLRISPHSQTNHRGNKIAKAVKKPWEG